MHRWMGVLVAVAACGPGPNFAGLQSGPRRATFTDRIAVQKLTNGLRVAVLPDSRTNLVAVEVRYNVGGADDPTGDSGLAHYVEHVLWEAPLRRDKKLRDMSLDGNAMTLLDRTYFYATALDADLDAELELAARRLELQCTDLEDPALARERDVVVEELKLHSQFRWKTDAIAAAIWGPTHPYAHGPGGDGFTAASKTELCAFFEQHYGPASATLVVTGHVDDKVMDRIRARFEPIPNRAQAHREELPAPHQSTTLVTVPGLEKPTVMLVFDVPGVGRGDDAAVELFQGMHVPLGIVDTQVRFADVTIMGDERQRKVIAYAEVDEVSNAPHIEHAMRVAFSRPWPVEQFAFGQQVERNRFIAEFDDLVGTGIRIADLFALDQHLNRYGQLHEIDALTEDKVRRLFDASTAHAVMLVPEANVASAHHVAELATEIHDVEVSRNDSVDLEAPALPSARVPRTLVNFQLANGLRVWLAPDPDAIAIDARLVISTGPTSDDKLAQSAALQLQSDDGYDEGLGTAVMDRISWYRSIGAPVTPRVDTDSTTFRISGFSLFGDWHVWNLAWTVLHGSYSWRLDYGPKPKQPKRIAPPQPPSAMSVVERRLLGQGDPTSKWTTFSTDQLEAYRQSAYRPDQTTLIVSGKFDVHPMRKEIESLFGDWHGGSTGKTAAPAKRVALAPSYTLIPADDAPTISIAIAFAPATESPRSEKAARDVLSEIVNDRLRVIREGLGVSYGVYARVSATAVLIGGDVEPAYANEAARAFMQEIEHVRAGYPELEADFARARKRVLARAIAAPVGAAERAEQLQQVAIDHVSLDQPDRDVDAIQVLDLESVRSLAARELRPDRMIAALRGPTAAIRGAITALGIDPAKAETLKPAK